MKMITYSAAARKALNKMDAAIAQRIKAGIIRYAETGTGDVKALRGVAALRLRVGDYRIIFTETFDIVAVEKIGNRNKIYQ
jgi:mRNA interferase RelE/StbE